MRKAFLIYIGISAALAFNSCESEEALTPSNLDSDRVGDFVASADNEYINTIYTKYNCGLMYEYDPILDFAYTAENDDAVALWEQVSLPMVKEEFVDSEGLMSAENVLEYNQYISNALTFIDTTIFQYFGDEGLMVENMPYKVLLCNSVSSAKSLATAILTESDSRYGAQAINVVNCAFNNQSIVFNINEDFLSQETKVANYRKDNFYIFLSRIMEQQDLYEEVPEEFFTLSSPYYGESIEEVYASDFGIDLEDDSEDAETVPTFVDKEWFYEKGFVDARYFYGSSGLSEISGEKVINKSLSFLASEELDVRSFLNEMIHRDEEELLAFPDVIKEKMKVLLTTIEDWGVDMKAFNPALEVL